MIQRFRRSGVLLAIVLLVSSRARPAYAEASAAERASARAFLTEGLALRKSGDHVGALKKFRAAYSLVPSPITGVALAREQIELGALVEARESLHDVHAMPMKSTESEEAKKARVEGDAMLSELLPKIPILEVEILGAPVGSAVTLTLDGQGVPAVAAAEGLRVNPGTHTIVASASASGVTAQTKTVVLALGAHDHVALTFSATAPKAIEPALPIVAVTPAPSVGHTEASANDGEKAGSGARIVGLATFGVGIVGMGIGGYLALSAKSNYDDAKGTYCGSGVCNEQGKQLTDDARSRGVTATIVFAVGTAVAVGGAVVWLTAPHGSRSAVRVGVGPSGVSIAGGF